MSQYTFQGQNGTFDVTTTTLNPSSSSGTSPRGAANLGGSGPSGANREIWTAHAMNGNKTLSVGYGRDENEAIVRCLNNAAHQGNIL